MKNLEKNVSITEQKIAFDSVKIITTTAKRYVVEKKQTIFIQIENEKNRIEIPQKAFLLLNDIILAMSENKNVAIVTTNQEITTQDFANMLNVSRPYVVKLLENGKIPYKKVGKHRRILYNDAVKYQEKFEKERSKNLETLAKQTQELNLGY